MTKQLYRTLQNALLLLTIVVIATAFYLQYIVGLVPCPLCLMQRFFIFILLTLAILAVCKSTFERSRFLATFQMLFAFIGLFFATRQLWLQHLPAGLAPACVPDLSVLMHYFPWKDIVHSLVWGAGDCSEIPWAWLGLSMAAWSALYFIIMFIVSGFIFFRLGSSITRVEKKPK